MDWGNAIVRSKTVDPSTGVVTGLILDLHLEGDFRKTKKKITWLSAPTTNHPLIPVALLDYDYLITKKKLEEGDNLDDFITPVTEFREDALADANVNDLKPGDIIQFERKGYFVYDGENITGTGKKEFIKIPDGRAAGLASKAGISVAPTPTSASKSPAPPEEQPSTMYKVNPIYGTEEAFEKVGGMYQVNSVYDS